MSISYDNTEGGADFIISTGKDKIIFEVGFGNKGIKQIIQTSKKVSAKYGLLISRNKLSYFSENNIVQIPIEYFLLSC